MQLRSIARLALLLTTVTTIGCGGATPEASPASSTNGGGESVTSGVTSSGSSSTAPDPGDLEPQTGAPSASAECGGYLVHYQRCEPRLAADIASGQRRTYEAEAAWVHFMESSPEGPGMPAACASMDRDLAGACP